MEHCEVEILPDGIAEGSIDWFMERLLSEWKLRCVGEGKGKKHNQSKGYLKSLDSPDTEL